jgi:hypothetical protein
VIHNIVNPDFIIVLHYLELTRKSYEMIFKLFFLEDPRCLLARYFQEIDFQLGIHKSDGSWDRNDICGDLNDLNCK